MVFDKAFLNSESFLSLLAKLGRCLIIVFLNAYLGTFTAFGTDQFFSKKPLYDMYHENEIMSNKVS